MSYPGMANHDYCNALLLATGWLEGAFQYIEEERREFQAGGVVSWQESWFELVTEDNEEDFMIIPTQHVIGVKRPFQ